MNRADRPGGFERWLDREMARTIAAEAGEGPPPPLRSRPRAGVWSRTRGVATMVAVALVVAGGVVVAAARPNPVRWGHQVIQSVSVGALAPLHTPTPAPAAVRPGTAAGQRDQVSGPVDAKGDQQAPQSQAAPTPSPSPSPGKGKSHAHGHQKGQNQQQ